MTARKYNRGPRHGKLPKSLHVGDDVDRPPRPHNKTMVFAGEKERRRIAMENRRLDHLALVAHSKTYRDQHQEDAWIVAGFSVEMRATLYARARRQM